MASKDSARCDVTGNSYPKISVRECPSPAVIKHYGVGGVAHVCVYVCQKCKHKITYPYHGGLGCALDTAKRSDRKARLKRLLSDRSESA